LSAIQVHYECASGLTCGPSFDITIQKGAHQKKTTVIDCRVPFLLAFVQELNHLLHEACQSVYISHLQQVAQHPGLIGK
jgi:hypothetical protein